MHLSFTKASEKKKFPDYLLLKISNGFSKILDVVFDAFLKFAKKKPKSLTTSEKHQKCILCAITKDLVKKKSKLSLILDKNWFLPDSWT